jgi:D-apionolactonase
MNPREASMTSVPSRAVMLFGTEEPVTPPKLLHAGPLTCELEAGNLRYIRVAGREALRALAFIVRNKDWGTYSPEISNLEVKQEADRFEVSYDARCKDDVQELTYQARITGARDGSLAFDATGRAVTDFLTNRTGFVILHSIEGVAGEPVEVLHVDGTREHSTFPALIDPTCPFQDIRALTHEVLPGVTVTCTMEGDAFEMEDHRNWNDASYKTYVRPLAKPWPYMIKADEITEQSVRLTLKGSVPQVSAGAGPSPVRVTVGDRGGTMPRIGLSLRPEHLEATLVAADAIRRLAPQFLICPFDSRIADGYAGPAVIGRSTFPFDRRVAEPGKVMTLYRAMGEATRAELVLEAVIACQDADGNPSADHDIMHRDIEAIRAAADSAGVRFARVSVSPASDLKCTLPGSVWPPCPPAETIYAAARKAFPNVPLGGGMFSYFTELNRKRPPADLLDFVVHTTCPIVHACDDRTAMENLEALPHIIRSAAAFIHGKPYCVGPSSIGARDNPYGAAATPNPANGRVALAYMDPRQRGLLGAAWNLGYVAHMARGHVDSVCLSAPVGEFGVVYAGADYTQPWFDQQGHGVYPGYHVLRGMAAAAGTARLETTPSDGSSVQSVAWRSGGDTVLWLANLTGAAQTVEIEGLPQAEGRIAQLDESSFERAASGPDGFVESGPMRRLDRIDLAPYAVVRLVVPG